MLRNTDLKFGSVSKFFHWLVFLLVVTLILVGFFWGYTGTIKVSVINVHKLVGLLTLIIVLLRIWWTLSNRKPQIPNAKLWEKIAVHSTHGLIYLALIGMPISGWLMSTAAGYPPHILAYTFGMPGVTKNMALAGTAADVHLVLAWILITLVSLHILAAFKHHFINKDNVLKRMLPGNWT
jgi:cytochrome b561